MAPKRPHDESGPKAFKNTHKTTASPSGGKSSTSTKSHKPRLESLPDGAWKRKLLREKATAIAQSKSARAYSKIRKQHEREKARQEAVKAKAKASGTVVHPPPTSETASDADVGAKDARGVSGDDKAGSSSENEHFSAGESEPEWEEEGPGRITRPRPRPRPRNAFEQTRGAEYTPENLAQKETSSNNASSEPITSYSSSIKPPSPARHKPSSNAAIKSAEPTPENPLNDSQQHQEQAAAAAAADPSSTDGEMHPSRARLLAQKSFLSIAALKAARRREKLAHRALERERRNEERNRAIADRDRIRRMMRKAKEPGRDGRRKLGKESTVLLEQVRKMVSGREKGRKGGG